MKMINKTENLITSTVLILIILLTSFVSAFGVSSSYWKGRPLETYPGQKTTVILTLQNMVSEEDETVFATIIKGSEIASISQNEYIVKAGTKDTEVPVKIEIPSDTENKEYAVTVSFSTITPSEGGGVALGIGVDTTFPVLVTGTPPEKPVSANLTWILIIAIAIISVIIIAAIVLKRKKK